MATPEGLFVCLETLGHERKGDRNRRVVVLVVVEHAPPGRGRKPAGLHGGQPGPGRLPAFGADDPGDGDGVHLRDPRRLLGGQAGCGCRGRGRHHRSAAHPGVRAGPGAVDVDDRDGGAPHRREGPGGGGDHRRSGDHPRRPGRRAHRSRRPPLAEGAASPHGGVAFGGGVRVELRRVDDGRERHHPPAVPDQRDLPRRGRRVGGHAFALGGERCQPGPRPVPDLRPRAVPGDGDHGCGHWHDRRPGGGRRLPAPAAVARRPGDGGKRAICASTSRCSCVSSGSRWEASSSS